MARNKKRCQNCADFRNCFKENQGLMIWFLPHMKDDLKKVTLERILEELLAANCKDYKNV